MKAKGLLIGFAVMLCLCTCAQAAQAPYYTMTQDHNDRFVYSQAGYVPDLTLYEFDGKALKRPADIYVADDDTLFIADSGNKRVIHSTRDGEFIASYGESELKTPLGVCVWNNQVYVADETLKKVVAFDLTTGEKTFELGKPTELLYGQENDYRPQAVALDKAGCLYVIVKGNPNGIAQFSRDGVFQGYFGANALTLSAYELFKRAILTEEQLSGMAKNIGSSPTNLAMDDRGLVYTVTGGTSGVKRLSMSGNNTMPDVSEGFEGAVDVAVGAFDNIFVLDQNGYIMEYTRDGRVLFYFAGQDPDRSRSGLFAYARAIDVDSLGYLYVVDRDKATVQRFAITEYARQVHYALSLYQEGLYAESREPWENLLAKNSMFDYAYMGLGRAYYKLGRYDEALTASRLGGDKKGYSDAFWEVRNTYLQENILWLVALIVALVVLIKVWRVLKKKWKPAMAAAAGLSAFGNLRLIRQLRWGNTFLRNPADAFYGVKREKRVSVLSASIMYLLFFAFYMIDKYTCGYLFRTVTEGQFEIGFDLTLVFGGILLFLIAANLICNIRDGEGTIKQMYCSMAYILTPYLVLKPISYACTFVLTQNEAFIITLINFVILLWCALLMVLMIRYLHEYTMKETIVVMLLTVFTMLMMIIALIIIAVMVGQLGDFVTSVWKEAAFFYES